MRFVTNSPNWRAFVQRAGIICFAGTEPARLAAKKMQSKLLLRKDFM